MLWNISSQCWQTSTFNITNQRSCQAVWERWWGWLSVSILFPVQFPACVEIMSHDTGWMREIFWGKTVIISNHLSFLMTGKTVIISNQPYFYKKAELFPGSAFVIGADTAARLINVCYLTNYNCIVFLWHVYVDMHADLIPYGRI